MLLAPSGGDGQSSSSKFSVKTGLLRTDFIKDALTEMGILQDSLSTDISSSPDLVLIVMLDAEGDTSITAWSAVPVFTSDT